MKKLRNCLEIVERWREGKVVELTFNCGGVYRYTDFEMLDESIYDNDSMCVAVLLDVNGIRTNGMAQFNISEIVKIVDVENGQVLYEL